MKNLIYLLLLTYTSTFANHTENKKPRYKAIYYNDNVIEQEMWFNKKDEIGSLKTYYKTGKLDEIFFYKTKNRMFILE